MGSEVEERLEALSTLELEIKDILTKTHNLMDVFVQGKQKLSWSSPEEGRALVREALYNTRHHNIKVRESLRREVGLYAEALHKEILNPNVNKKATAVIATVESSLYKTIEK